MFKKNFIALLLLVSFLIPIFSHAEFSAGASGNPSTATTSTCNGGTGIKNITDLFNYAICLLGGFVVPFLVGLGLVLFIVGVVNYVRAGDNEEKREAGRGLMIFGIIALFVMISVWGFVKILSQTFFGHDNYLPTLPGKDPNAR